MPWLIRAVVDDINKAVTWRWRHLDPLLPEPSDLSEGCMAPLLAERAAWLRSWPNALHGSAPGRTRCMAPLLAERCMAPLAGTT
jgi:hypothetical protein